MGKLRVLILLPFLVCCSLIIVNAQSATTLKLGTPVERSLETGEAHEFTINVEENSFVHFVVEQRGIDVSITVSSPAGKGLGEYDTPNGADGPEHVSFVAVAAGTYRISISPLNPEGDNSGKYEIKLLEVREATEEEIKASKNLEVVRAKGIALLTELETTIQEIKSPRGRIEAQLKAAELLWEHDEKRAAKFIASAIAGIKEFLATADTASEQYAQQYDGILQLRNEVIQLLAERDPDAALAFLHSTAPRYSPNSNPRALSSQENELELAIASQIIEKDPNRAAQIARQSLKKGYSTNLVGTVSQLVQKNSELAAELVHEIAAKLLSEEQLIKQTDATNLTILFLNSFGSGGEPVQVITKNQMSPLRSDLLSEDEYKQLLRKAVGEVVSYSLTSGRMYGPSMEAYMHMILGLQSLGAELDRAVSGSKAAIEKKKTELMGVASAIVDRSQEYQKAIGENPVEAALESIEKAPADFREQLYIQLANREAEKGELARAKQIINDHVTNPYQRRQALTNLEQQEMYRAVGKGKIEEALKTVGSLRTPRERAAQLSQILDQIGPGQKQAIPISVLEQAREMLSPSPQAQDQDQMHALFELARAFSHYDSKRSFEIVDPLIEQFNDLCAAARTLEGFGGEYYEDDELILQEGNGLAPIVSQMSNVLGSLALTNFERAKSATEKIRLPEVRLRVYLEIAQQTIEGGPLNLRRR